MTEISRPWQGTTIGDAGPYSDTNWQNIYQRMVRTLNTENSGGIVPASGAASVLHTGLRIKATSPASTQVNVSPGSAFIFGIYYELDATEAISISGNASGNDRIDTICLQIDYTAQTIRLHTREGTPSGSPVPPTLTQISGSVWDFPLADVLAQNGFVTITDADITYRAQYLQNEFSCITLYNTSGAAIEHGTGVIFDTANDQGCDVVASDDDSLLGIAVGRSVAGGPTQILQRGVVYLYLDSAVTRGDEIYATTTLGQCSITPQGSSIIGIALESTSGAGYTLCYVNIGAVKWVPIELREEQPSNTSGATPSTSAWGTRILNTVVKGSAYASLSSNVLTLSAGIYRFTGASASFLATFDSRMRFYDTDNSSVIAISSNAGNGSDDNPPTLTLLATGQFVIAADTDFELQYYVLHAGVLGAPVNSGENEIYAICTLERMVYGN